MAKASPAQFQLPPAVIAALRKLGEHLAIARVRRRESQRAWAKRLGVSVPTVIRLERGDPGIGTGILATALWMVGCAPALAELADPANDRGALERDIQLAVRRRSVRSAAAAQLHLQKGRPKGG